MEGQSLSSAGQGEGDCVEWEDVHLINTNLQLYMLWYLAFVHANM